MESTTVTYANTTCACNSTTSLCEEESVSHAFSFFPMLFAVAVLFSCFLAWLCRGRAKAQQTAGATTAPEAPPAATVAVNMNVTVVVVNK